MNWLSFLLVCAAGSIWGASCAFLFESYWGVFAPVGSFLIGFVWQSVWPVFEV